MRSRTLAASATCEVSCTSVVTGSPVASFTLCRVSRPFSSPGPRKDEIEVRLALSKDALKMRGMSNSRPISLS